MRLVLCEKPSQGRDIAKFLGATQRGDGFLSGPGVTVTWARGHLLETAEPEVYGEQYGKPWRTEVLPLLPQQWKLVVKADAKAQFAVINRLLKQVDEVVIATDADREGEVIARELLDYCKFQGRIFRLWMSALDDASIRAALSDLWPSSRTEALYYAGVGRSRADWLIGMNLTRLFTLKGREAGIGNVLSVGRVQTPTLAIVVQRDREIENFVAKPYFEVIATLAVNGAAFPAKWVPANRGQTAADNPEIQGPPKKPVMLVVLEWFTGQHSVYRTHSRALAALRGRFIVHAVGLDMAVDSAGRQVFDVFHGVSTASALQEAYVLASELRPDVVLYAGIGMFPFTIYLSNLRLAPLQLVGLGHGASTFCGQINGFVIEEDLVGEERCFSEAVIRVPADAMPFVPPADIRRVPVTRTPFLTRQQAQWREPLPVRVAVCASVMKINPNFLSTLAEVQRRSRVAMQFCFYMGFAQGLTLDYLRDAIHAVLPGAEVNGHMPVQAYQAALNSCELFVSPFPYGNMNGVVDAVRQGLPGVCLSGPEVHSHIDGGLFRRLGLPEELIATGYEAYIRAVLRLVEEHDWREMLQHRLLDNDVEQVLFQGHPEKFAAVISDAWQQVRLGVVPSGTVPKARRRKSL